MLPELLQVRIQVEDVKDPTMGVLCETFEGTWRDAAGVERQTRPGKGDQQGLSRRPIPGNPRPYGQPPKIQISRDHKQPRDHLVEKQDLTVAMGVIG